MLGIAEVLSQRATCPKLAVGAVLVDSFGRIIGSGYNGVPHAFPHCIDRDCGGAMLPNGSDRCMAVHAEQNALLNCRDVQRISTLYVTHSPCLRCTKELLNTSCHTIVIQNQWPPSEVAMDMWLSIGRKWSYV